MLSNCGVGEDSWEPLGQQEIKSVNPKGNQPWIFIRMTDAEALILWPPDAKSWLIEKDADAGKDSRQEEKGTSEDEMAGWYHWLSSHAFEQTLEDNEGQGSLGCCSSWSCRVGHDWAAEQWSCLLFVVPFFDCFLSQAQCL